MGTGLFYDDAVKQKQICPMIKRLNLFLSQDSDSIGLDC